MRYILKQDEDASDPRVDFDNVGIMVCFHRRYTLGDKHPFDSPADFEQWWKDNGKGGVRLLLYLYDHSGITMNTTGFSCPWDSGQVGYIYATRDTILKEWGNGKRLTAKASEQARKCLVSEVEVYDQYLTGDVYGFIVVDEDGKHLDSCWGFYGREYAEQQAKEALAYCQKQASEQAEALQLASHYVP